MTGRLADAIAGTDWTLQTPRLARRPVGDRLVAYVSAVPDHDGVTIAHWGWWVEYVTAVTASGTTPTAGGAVRAADAALGRAAAGRAS